MQNSHSSPSGSDQSGCAPPVVGPAAQDNVDAAKGAARNTNDAAANAQDQVGLARDQAVEWVGLGAAHASMKRH